MKSVEKNKVLVEKSWKWYLVLLLLLMIPIQAQAFSFDIWESGISLADAKMLASKESVYLQEPKVDTAPQFDKQYNAKLFGKPVIVRLYFTAKDRKLYTLSVRWEQNLDEYEIEDFSQKIEKILVKKYGRGKGLKGNTSSYRHGAKCHDSIEGIYIKNLQDTVSMYHSTKCELAVLTYVDEDLKLSNSEYLDVSKQDDSDVDKL